MHASFTCGIILEDNEATLPYVGRRGDDVEKWPTPPYFAESDVLESEGKSKMFYL